MTWLALKHLKGAALNARAAAAVENATTHSPSDQEDCEAFAMAAVIMSVAFLEASINEYFVKVEQGLRDKMTLQTAERLRRMWRLRVPKTAAYSVVKKYEIALALLDHDPFANDRAYLDGRLLTDLRNALVHFEPEWVSDSLDTDGTRDAKPHKFEKSLRDRFPESRLASKADLFFPHRCLGSGAATWALNVAVTFYNEFAKRASETPASVPALS